MLVRQHFTLRGSPTSVDEAWSLVGDTDQLGRLAQSPSIRLSMVPENRSFTEVGGTMVGPGPLRHSFVESQAQWVHHRRFELIREVRGPFMCFTHYQAFLEPGDGHVVPVISFEARFHNTFAGMVGWPSVQRTQRAWHAALSRLPRPELPPAPVPRRSLPPLVKGLLQSWQSLDPAHIAVVQRVHAHLESARMPELSRLRPWALADAWGLDRNHVLNSFLEGVLVGALELVWVTRCPRCAGPVDQSPSLSNIADHAECPSCRINVTPHLDESVEVVFAAHPSLRTSEPELFCTLYPAENPAVRAMMVLAPGEQRTLSVPLAAGQWQLGAGGDIADQTIAVAPSGPAELYWSAEGAPPAVVGAGEVTLHLSNPTPYRQRVRLAQIAEADNVVSAARLATHPVFRQRFGPQALAPDVRLSVRAIAVVFTDLAGSAAMYEAHGDATAFSLVHAHFALLDEAVRDFGGVRVKTIGDGSMSVFLDPAQAVLGTLEMQRRFAAWVTTLDLEIPPALRIGIHWGPALAVHTDQSGLDWFGGTVNLAARTESRSPLGEVTWTQAVHEAPGVDEALARAGVVVSTFSTPVKGIREPIVMYHARPILNLSTLE